jgi:hypothetical protein
LVAESDAQKGDRIMCVVSIPANQTTSVSFFASKDGFPIGTYKSYEEAIESLEWRGRANLL